MSQLKPWADGAFDLILHAEICLRKGTDFDRRIALISFDNAIEVAITTYLTLHPVQRKNVTYTRVDVEKWLTNFHSKLDFVFDEFIPKNGCPVSCDKAELVWCHETRNGQYHAGGSTIPREREIEVARSGALEIFSKLFDVADVDGVLESRILELDPDKDKPKRESDGDKLIDEAFGMVSVGGQTFYTSEALYALDPIAYHNLVVDLKVEAWMKGTDENEDN